MPNGLAASWKTFSTDYSRPIFALKRFQNLPEKALFVYLCFLSISSYLLSRLMLYMFDVWPVWLCWSHLSTLLMARVGINGFLRTGFQLSRTIYNLFYVYSSTSTGALYPIWAETGCKETVWSLLLVLSRSRSDTAFLGQYVPTISDSKWRPKQRVSDLYWTRKVHALNFTIAALTIV